MKLTLYTDYCLRVLMYLGLKDGELATIKEIADHYAVSRNHLMKVVYELNRMGYIQTVRGKNGGLRLRQQPSDINLGELVRRTESDLVLVECFGESNRCCIASACALKPVLAEAMHAFFAVLDRYHVDDLLAPRAELGALLGLPGRPAA